MSEEYMETNSSNMDDFKNNSVSVENHEKCGCEDCQRQEETDDCIINDETFFDGVDDGNLS